jgi:GNAT superfamily N-acetyltransferase
MPTPQAASHIHQLLDEHWTTILGVAPSVWRDAEVVVASHPEPSHSEHVYLLHREGSCIIVVPQALVGSTTIACSSWPSDAVFDRSFVRSVWGSAVTSMHGPYWLGYATSESFRAVDGRGTRRLGGPQDEAALAAVRSLCTDEEIADAGFGMPARRDYGCFVDGTLVSAGSLTPFRGAAANVGVLTHPEHRNQGYGTAVLSALTAIALAESSAAQFRALGDHRAALRMARILGYVEDAQSLEVTLDMVAAGDIASD